MIHYSNEGYGPFAVNLFFQWYGSVIHKAFATAIVPAIVAGIINYFNYSDAKTMTYEDFVTNVGSDTLKASHLWGAMGATLVFMIGFRTNKAYARFWDGTTLLHQMWGEWFDAASCLVAFTTLSMRDQREAALDFRHTLVRLCSLMHASALEEISMTADEEYGYPTLDIGNLDQSSLQYLKDCKFDKNLNFNRVEVLVHMIQTLVVHNHDTGVIKIPPPILSRVFQTLSRGQVNLANCKKITTTLFPFPYAQLIAFLLLMYMVMTPILMGAVCEKVHWAFIFTLIPIFGLSSLNYIARELEMPFGSDANDLPLLEFQEHMNDSMLMLIREESDHVAHTSMECVKDFQSTKDGITEMRPKHFLDPTRERDGVRCSLPPPKVAPPPAPEASIAMGPVATNSAASLGSLVRPPPAMEPKMQATPRAVESLEPTQRALEQVVHTITQELSGMGKALMTCADMLGTQLVEKESTNGKKPIPGQLPLSSWSRQREMDREREDTELLDLIENQQINPPEIEEIAASIRDELKDKYSTTKPSSRA